ncbi:MAG: glutamate--cysteine ligase [Methylococcales bacterium]|nr:glutamate--cysteine ligase [Methylococcales bacterium]
MGQEISASQFDKSDFNQFHQKLKQETTLLKEMIEQNACSMRAPVAGFEIEASIVDKDMHPSPINEHFLASLNSPLAFEELAKFNIELNSTPTPLAGNVFSHMYKQLQSTWNSAYEHAESLQNQLIMIGTLPTLKQSDLNLANMSDLNRYRALNDQIFQSRKKPINLDITGNEHLKLAHEDVMLESATTSFQIHIQLPFDIAHHFYNASIMASAPIVALCANSPYLFGKDLWHESRIPLFEQAIETGGFSGAAQGPLKRVSFGTDYARKSIIECFNENLEHFPILLPENLNSSPEAFEHLRLHNGTIWRWNRPLIGFDEDGTPHIRVEHRTPAAGPTTIDSIANAAFYYGVSKNLCDEIMEKGLSLPFSQAKDNFYQAARHGLDSHIIWLDGKTYRLHSLIKNELMPRAILGLQSLGISRCDTEDFLDVIMQRLNNKQNGCHWQRQFMLSQAQPIQTDNNFKLMTQVYLKKQQSGNPVSEWSSY